MNDKTHLKHKRRNKKLLLLFLVFGITTLAFIGITYAWFVGIGQVKVNTFTVNLKTDNALEISLDGYTWDEEISVDETKIKAHSENGLAYENNKNSWVGENGLIPVSSSGDNTNGRLKIFTKSSLSATNGGYRLIASNVDNGTNEKDYYVAFDIFVKNKTGDVYTSNYNLLDDENIYMTLDSIVTGTPSGNTSYGVQNSARVAFIQIGRISLDELEENTTPVIKCETPASGDKYTPLCNANGNIYNTVIWEPNNLTHDQKLVNYYNYVCKNKTNSGGTISYGENPCTSLSTYSMTNTVKRNILSSDNVDIYDGLNGYTDSIQADSNTVTKPLQATKTFTDTMKNTNGDYTFMKLHPHSVTKIRVYVYLEGQDVDNYDLITNDQDIVVSFGLTKERTSYGNIQDEDDTSINQTLTVSHASNNDYNALIDYPSSTTSMDVYVDNTLKTTIKPNNLVTSSSDYLNRIINIADMPSEIRTIYNSENVTIGNQTFSTSTNRVFPLFDVYNGTSMKAFINGNYYRIQSIASAFEVGVPNNMTVYNILTKTKSSSVLGGVPCILVEGNVSANTWDGNIIISEDIVDNIPFGMLKAYFPDNSPISYDINSLTNTSGTHTIKIVAKNGSTTIDEKSITYIK